MSEALEFVEGRITLRLDRRTYRESAIKKAAYRCADRFTAIFGPTNGELIDVSLQFRSGTSEASARESARVFFQELLDQELRELVSEETASLRTLILAQAFSKTNLIGHE